MKHWSYTIALLLSTALLFFCSDDYNPFSVADHANLHIAYSTFESGDSLSIFSSETLQVLVTVREKVDSFNIKTLNNRFWEDTTIDNLETPQTYTFPISFTQTGTQDIFLNTFRSNGDVVPQTIRLHTFSPLNQSDLKNLFIGQRIRLSTQPVKDSDILYRWNMGGYEIFSSQSDTNVIFMQNGPGVDFLDQFTGSLQIFDYRYKKHSPKWTFSYTYNDTTPPKIALAMRDFTEKDTIRVNNNIIAVTFKIADQFEQPVSHATINNDSFDIYDSREQTYTKVFNNLKSAAKIALDVTASKNNISSSRTYVLMYDPNAETKTNTIIRRGAKPDKDTIVVFQQRKADFFGIVQDPTRSSIRITSKINNKEYKDTTIAINADQGEGKWLWENLPLSQINSIDSLLITAFDTAGAKLADKTFYFLYDPNGDTIPPVIYKIEFDGVSRRWDENYVAADSVFLKITTFDEGSGIQSFFVNELQVPASSINSYLREVTVNLHSLDHNPDGHSGTTVNFKAIDKYDNEFDTSMVFIYNIAPVIQRDLNFPYVVKTGTMYTDTVRCVSEDDDSVFLSVDDSLSSMSVQRLNKKQWIIQWKPSLADTGKTDSIQFFLNDQKERSRTYTDEFYIIDSAKAHWKVRFLNKEDQLPDFLEVGSDTLELEFDIKEAIPPYSYHVSAMRKKDALIDTIIDNDSINWIPQISDTGNVHFKFIVSDQLRNSDTLFKNFLIVKPNRPCSIYVDDMYKEVIDMSTKQDPDTIDIYIDDPDSAYMGEAEWISLRLSLRGDEITLPLTKSMKAEYVIPVKPEKYSVDTLTIIAVDRKFHADTLKIPVLYGEPSPKPLPLYPSDSSMVEDTSISFRWSAPPDSQEVFTYSVFWIEDQASTALAENVSDTFLVVNDLNKSGTYSWYITMTDSNKVYYSDTSVVFLQNPGHVKFKTKENIFPTRMYAQKDSFSIMLELDSSSKHAPFIFSAKIDESDTFFEIDNENPILSFRPDEEHLGMSHWIITVSDSNNNADTLFPLIEIVQNNPDSFRIDLRVDGVTFTDSILDMTVLDSHQLTFTLDDTYHDTTALYTMVIEQDGLELFSQIDASVSDSFTIQLKPDISKRGYRNLTAFACKENTTICDSLTLQLFYGDTQIRGPQGITQNIKVWLRADTALVLDDNNAVRYWYDISGNYHHAKGQTEGSILPQYISSCDSLNNIPAVQFAENSTSWLQLKDFGLHTGEDEFSVFMVLSSNKATSTYFSSGTNLICSRNSLSYNETVSIPTNFTDNSIVGIVQNLDSVSLFENGLLEAKGETLNRNSFDDSSIVFGKNTVDPQGHYFGGCLAELVIYDRALTHSEKVTLESYFSEKYNLSTGEVATKHIAFTAGEVLSNVPVLVRLDEIGFDFSSAGPQGEGLRVTDASRENYLPFEIASWDKENEAADIWISVPEVHQDSTIDVFVDSDDLVSFSNPQMVFPSTHGFAGVWHFDHLDENSIINSSSNQSTAIQNDLYHNSAITNCLTFMDSSKDVITISDPSINLVSDFTISAWIRLHETDKGWQPIISMEELTVPSFYLNYYNNADEEEVNDTGYALASHLAPLVGNEVVVSSELFQPDTNSWYHVAMVYTASEGKVAFYLNGDTLGTSQTTPEVVKPIEGNIEVGGKTFASPLQESSFYFNGKIDELRLESIARPATWIKFCYDNQLPQGLIEE